MILYRGLEIDVGDSKDSDGRITEFFEKSMPAALETKCRRHAKRTSLCRKPMSINA